jgi:predicted nucleic acid-binding protein
MSKVLVDTNVLIYAKDSSSIYHLPSLTFLEGGDELYTTSKNLNEYYSVVTRGESPLLTPQEALQDLEEFVSRFEVLYPTEASRQKLFDLVLQRSLKGLKIHDLEIASVAIVNGIRLLATFNSSDFNSIDAIEPYVPK